MNYMDLHLHSNCSDGMLDPEELVEAARNAGLAIIAICDHDSVDGIARAVKASREYNMQVITGVELSVAYKGLNDIHLLGYCFDSSSTVLLEHLETFALRRANRNREIVLSVNLRLEKQGLQPLTFEEVEKLAEGVMGRPHIARALITHGYAATMEDAFTRYLIPCDVPKTYWAMEDAIATIKQAGGVAVLAHPTSISTDFQVLETIITELAIMGLDGLEVYNSMATEQEAAFLQKLANRQHLLVTAGSDFHGIDSGDTIGKGRGGIRFSDALLPPLLSRAAERQNVDQIFSLKAL